MFPLVVLFGGSAMGLGGIDIIPDLFHVAFYSGYGRRQVLHEFHC